MAELTHEHARLMLVRDQLDALARVPAERTPAAAQMAQRTVKAARARGGAFRSAG